MLGSNVGSYATEESTHMKIFELSVSSAYGTQSTFFTRRDFAMQSYEFTHGRDYCKPRYSIVEHELLITWTDLRLKRE